MTSDLEQVTNSLFPREGSSRIGNVKFYEGTSRDVTAEQLADQLVRANVQIETGTAVRIEDIDSEVVH